MPNRIANTALYLAIDQGGHATRALVFDRQGHVCAQAEVPIDTFHATKDGMQTVELDAQQLIDSVTLNIQQIAKQLGDQTQNLVAAGLVTQRSTLVCWHRETGEALYPIISWQDTRAQAWLSQFEAKQAWIHDITGLFLSAHYGASKMHWCLTQVPAVRAAQQQGCLVIGPLSSFLTFHMLVERPLVVDPANATRTLLWNKQTCNWDNNLLDLFEIPLSILPNCTATRHDYGNLSIGDRFVPLQIVTGDQSAAIFSQGKPNTKTCYINIGSGAFLLRRTKVQATVADTLLTGVVYKDTKTSVHVVEATVNGAGNALQWFKQYYNYKDLEQQLHGWFKQDPSEILFINGIAGLASPFWIPKFESYFVGEGNISNKAIALLESVIFLLQVNLNVMEQTLPKANKIIISGGLAQQDELCQQLADIALRPVYRSAETEATAKGLAYLLMGFPTNWSNAEFDTKFIPQENAPLQARFNKWQQLMYEIVDQIN